MKIAGDMLRHEGHNRPPTVHPLCFPRGSPLNFQHWPDWSFPKWPVITFRHEIPLNRLSISRNNKIHVRFFFVKITKRNFAGNPALWSSHLRMKLLLLSVLIIHDVTILVPRVAPHDQILNLSDLVSHQICMASPFNLKISVKSTIHNEYKRESER
jgi:hypothetical protein